MTPPAGDVHLVGLCDINNFGDTLFPLLAQYRLAPLGYNVVAVSPTGQRAAWPDAPASTTLETLARSVPASAGMLIGGGNIIIGTPLSKFEGAVAELWLAATWFACARDIPLAWNAPGVPRPFLDRGLGSLARAAIGATDRIVVRDAASRSFLGRAGCEDAEIAPDTAIDLASMWPAAELAPVFRTLLHRKGWSAQQPLLAIHLRAKTPDEATVAHLGGLITGYARAHGCTPMLVAIGPAARDDIAIQLLSGHIRTPHITLDDPASLREIAAALAFSSGFVGQSLHACIAAAAYDVPGVLVGPPPARRFRGFLGQRGTPEAIAQDWETALGLLARSPARSPLPQSMHLGLEAHWRGISATVQSGPGKQEGRRAFLRMYSLLGTNRSRTALSPVASVSSERQAPVTG